MIELSAAQNTRFRPTVIWYTTFRCNLACKHCLVNSSPFVNTTFDMTTKEALTAVSRISEIEPSTVILTGGEPLMRPDIQEILQALFDKRFRVAIESNGMLVTDDLSQFLHKRLCDGVDLTVGVSVDGGDAETHEFQRGLGSFEAMLRGIKILRRYKIPVTIQCTVNRVNVSTLPSLFELCNLMGLERLIFAFVNPIGRAQEFMDQLGLSLSDMERCLGLIITAMETYPNIRTVIKLPPAMIPPHILPRFIHFWRKQSNGGALSTSCNFPVQGILPDGSITICSVTRTNNQAYLGNIKDDSLVDIWEHHRFSSMRERYLASDWLKNICGDCVFKKGCKGSCRSWAYTEYGGFSESHPLCSAMESQGSFPNIYRISYKDKLLTKNKIDVG